MTQTIERPVAGSTVLMLATGAGFSVASLYYSQPMLGILVNELHAAVTTVGLVPTLTQIGYALGILLLAPLGDRHDRRQIISLKGVILTLALLLSAFSGGIGMLLTASLAVGIAATMAQDIVPASAMLAPAAQRGKTVGTVMTGLLLGILLSRVLSGFVAEYFGWRTMFFTAAVMVAGITLILSRLPSIPPATTMSYPALLASMRHLWRDYAPLRRATLAQGLLSVGFSAFWSTLAVMLHDTYQLGSATAGTFGLAGAAGALAAPLAGSLADRRGPERVTRIGTTLATVSFALMFMLPLLPAPYQLALIVVSAIGFDFGVQSTLVSHQSIIFSLEPAARSRLNALMFTGVFIGMALGSALGSAILEHAGWQGVAILLTVSGFASMMVRMRGKITPAADRQPSAE
ncbi:MFS transporter [Pantoea sp. BAV 3049]|uniref:MFS transporter n=1 Tax=Pantoea sp. BAV 3049 TaxID=2654188 RepID=UPI001E2CFE57|nr:MFS transporter [Pantoea sp. BAV 3049]